LQLFSLILKEHSSRKSASHGLKGDESFLPPVPAIACHVSQAGKIGGSHSIKGDNHWYKDRLVTQAGPTRVFLLRTFPWALKDQFIPIVLLGRGVVYMK
jgi:hypothetical protein